MVLALGLLGGSVTARADERRLSPDGRFEYMLREDGTAILTNWIENSISIEVPPTVDGHPLTTIGSYAFQELYATETLHLPEGITTIRDYAFGGFFALKKINLPSSVVFVGCNPWVNCNDLTDFEIEGEDPPYFLSGGCLYSRDHTLISCLEGLCSGDTVYVLPDTKIIGEGAFLGRSGDVLRVVLPEGLEEIRAYSLSHLTEIEIPSTVSTIGDFAFHGCRMKDVTLPAGLRSIGANPFVMCSDLTDIRIKGENPRYSMFEGALYDLDTHTLISWPLGFTDPKPLILGETLVIGSHAFYFSRSEQIVLPEGLQVIEEAAFYYCSSLIAVNFPSSLRSIGAEAFANCESLNIPGFPDGLQEIGDLAFRFGSWTYPLYLPAGLRSMGADPFAGCELPRGIMLSPDNEHFVVENGFLYDTDEYKLIKYFSNAENVVVPDGIRTIGAYAFRQNETMLHAELPSSVETIEVAAFDDCISMESISFSENLAVIGSFAFEDCNALTEVSLPASLTLINDGAFAFDPGLKKVYLAGDHVTISPSAFFMTDATIIGPEGEITFAMKKNLPLY